MFQSIDGEASWEGSRAMKPSGGESNNLFESLEKAVPSNRTNKMLSNILGLTE